jgi:hypothetical protein
MLNAKGMHERVGGNALLKSLECVARVLREEGEGVARVLREEGEGVARVLREEVCGCCEGVA